MEAGKEKSAAAGPAAQAVEWLMALQEGDELRDRKAFTDWLQRSPVHVEEYLRLTSLQGELARLPELRATDVGTLLSGVQSSAASRAVVSLDAPAAGHAPPERNWKASARWIAAVAAVAVVAVVVVAAAQLEPIRQLTGSERHRTEVGEQRSLTLADGSEVQLNVLSRLSARINESVRDVRIEDGEALFRIAKNPRLPFRVRTPQATIEAKGTQFNVHVKDGETVVSLLEGLVEVRSTAPGVAPVRLEPGQEVAFGTRDARLATPHSADLATALAWTQRRLVFENATLSEVVGEFNRYSRQPLLIGDPALRNVRVTASFDAANVSKFADALASAGGLKVVHGPSGSWLIERN